jgi:hypothetical protein
MAANTKSNAFGDGCEHEEQRLAAARGDEDLLAIQVEPEASVVLDERLDELRQSLRRPVGDVVLVVTTQALQHRPRGGDVRLADVELVDLLSRLTGGDGEGCEPPDRGCRHARGAIGQRWVGYHRGAS